MKQLAASAGLRLPTSGPLSSRRLGLVGCTTTLLALWSAGSQARQHCSSPDRVPEDAESSLETPLSSRRGDHVSVGRPATNDPDSTAHSPTHWSAPAGSSRRSDGHRRQATRIKATGGRDGDAFYRDRGATTRSCARTHGVNCTGSCSWKVYVKDGIITWEAQQTDYPSAGADRPEYEPRGCPAAPPSAGTPTAHPDAIPLRPRRAGRAVPVRPRAQRRRPGRSRGGSIVEDPEKSQGYKKARGKGGLVRASWDEVAEIVAAAHVYAASAGARTGSPGSRPSPRCRRCRTRPGPASSSSSAHRCCRSTTGTPTCRTPRRRCSATRPTCPSPGTGGTPATSSCGARTCRRPGRPTPTG